MSSMVTFELISSVAFIILVLYQLYRKREAEIDPINEFLASRHADHVNEAADNLSVESEREPSRDDINLAAEGEQAVNDFPAPLRNDMSLEDIRELLRGAYTNFEEGHDTFGSTLISSVLLVSMTNRSRNPMPPVSLPHLSENEGANNALNQNHGLMGDMLRLPNDSEMPYNEVRRLLLEARQSSHGVLAPSEEVDESNNDSQPTRSNTNESLTTFGLFHRRNNPSRSNNIPTIEEDHPEQNDDKEAPKAHR